MLLLHGQASVERGFFVSRQMERANPCEEIFVRQMIVNKQMERVNLCEETFVTQRIVNDHVKVVGGVMSADSSKELLASYASSCRHCPILLPIFLQCQPFLSQDSFGVAPHFKSAIIVSLKTATQALKRNWCYCVSVSSRMGLVDMDAYGCKPSRWLFAQYF